MWRGSTAPLRTVYPAIGDPARLLEDRADKSNTPTSTAVHLPERQTQSQLHTVNIYSPLEQISAEDSITFHHTRSGAWKLRETRERLSV